METKKSAVILSLVFLLFFFSMNIYAQSITVTGSVKSASGSGLYGVSVMEMGTTNATITNRAGGFAINASAKSKLSFSCAGYQTSIVDVQGRMIINVVLEDENKAMNEVAIGYGTQRKERVTGSVSSIQGAELREVPASNITQALQGRVAGLQMSQTSTKPGAEMQIRIRGTHSFYNTNDPLIILDGIPFAGSISDISIDDIKNIDILKDASMTAIYGTRGANGVILITTGKGIKGQKMQITYNGYYGLKTAIKYPMMNAAEFIKLRALAGRYTNGKDESNDIDTDWQNLFYRTGTVTNHDLELFWGTKKGNYKFDVGYYKDQAVVPGSDYSRFSLRGSLEQEVGKFFRFGFSTNSNYNVSNGEDLGLHGVLFLTPIADPFIRDANGNITSTKRTVRVSIGDEWVYTRDVINNLGDQWIDKTKAYGSYNSLYGEVKIPGIEGLKYRINLGINYRNSNVEVYKGMGVFNAYIINQTYTNNGESSLFNRTVDHQLSYDRIFSQKHRLNVTALYLTEKTKSNVNETAYNDTILRYGYLSRITSDLNSIVGRVMYSFDDSYMISATVRSDASLKQNFTYSRQTSPAVSMGWNIRKATFMKHATSIDALKLRAGFGQVASTIERESDVTKNTGVDYPIIRSFLPGMESTVTKNAGLDFSIFKGRLSGAAEYYITNTKGYVLSQDLRGEVSQEKVGNIQNKGWEFTLKATVLKDLNGWSWDVDVNLYTNKNKVVALLVGHTMDMSNWLFVGHPINVIYDYKRIGLWNKTDADYKYMSTLEPNGNVGMIKVQYTGAYDETGKPVRAIDNRDRQIIDCDPHFMGGINTRLAYKGFDLVITGVFQSGGILNSTLYGLDSYLNMLNGRSGQIKVDYWTPDHTAARYPAPGGASSGDNPKYASTSGYFDASYLKINTITLGYNFTSKLLKNAGFEKLRLYGTLQHPFVFFSPYYNETGMDPQTNSYGNDNIASPSGPKRLLIVGFNTPSTKNFIMGVNVTF